MEQLSRLNLDLLKGAFAQAADTAGRQTDPQAASYGRFCAFVSAGDIRQALPLYGALSEPSWLDRLVFAVVAEAAGQSDLAVGARAQAATDMAAAGLRAERMVAAMLNGAAPLDVEQALELSMPSEWKSVVLTALAQTAGDERLLDLAERLNFRRGYPHFAIAHAIDRARKARR